MNKAEFMKELKERLMAVPEEDREDALCYYSEYIKDMEIGEDEDVTAKLGTPRDIAKSIISECSAKQAQRESESGEVKGGFKAIWLIILGAMSLPISIPFAVIAVTMAIIGLVVAGALAVGLIVGSAGGVIAGAVSVVRAFFLGSIGERMVRFGVGLVIMGGSVLIGTGTIAVCRMLIRRITSSMVRRAEKRKLKKMKRRTI